MVVEVVLYLGFVEFYEYEGYQLYVVDYEGQFGFVVVGYLYLGECVVGFDVCWFVQVEEVLDDVLWNGLVVG